MVFVGFVTPKMMGMNRERFLFLELIRRSSRDGRDGSLISASEAMVGGGVTQREREMVLD